MISLSLFAQAGRAAAQQQSQETLELLAVMAVAVGAVMIASTWAIFAKAGQPGWLCLIPIVNYVVLLGIAGRPMWWIILSLIPLLNLAVWALVCLSLARNFDKGMLFGIGLAILPIVFFPILAFSGANYVGESG